MNQRPLSIRVVGWLFLCVGAASIVAGTWRFFGPSAHTDATEYVGHDVGDLVLVWVSALMAGVGGAFVLRGRNWARWLLVTWMALHVILSLLHSGGQGMMGSHY